MPEWSGETHLGMVGKDIVNIPLDRGSGSLELDEVTQEFVGPVIVGFFFAMNSSPYRNIPILV